VITLEQNRLVFRFPEIHPKAAFSLSLQRTLRIPDDGRDHYLPPGLGTFPLRHVDDHADRVPPHWRDRGGLLTPMYQAEAMWLSFSAWTYPFALKVATGKINAVTGAEWSVPLNAEPQDYLILPKQPWLDGYCVEKGVIRQFVAAPMGKGVTVEEQLTGEATWGGIQLVAYPMKAERFAKLEAQREEEARRRRNVAPVVLCERGEAFYDQEGPFDMGLAAGGRMRQQIFEDDYDTDTWDQEHSSRCFLTIVNSTVWSSITGEPMPTKPVSTQEYAEAGLPWFDYYAETPALEGSTALQSVKNIATAWPDDDIDTLFDFIAPIEPGPVVPLGSHTVREMQD
jgi:hypothetical protein